MGMKDKNGTIACAFLGYPEPDAGCPFAAVIPVQQQFLLVAGILNCAGGYRDIQSSMIEAVSLSEIKTHLQSNAVMEVPYGEFLWLLGMVLKEQVAFEEVELMTMIDEQPVEPLFRRGEYNVKKAAQTHLLMHPETGVFFPLAQPILSEGIKGLVVALQNQEEIRRDIIDASVDTCAELCLNDALRRQWVIVLDALSIIYHSQGKEEACAVAQQNRRALELGLSGVAVPLIRDWVNQQLANSLALAQLMTRDATKTE